VIGMVVFVKFVIFVRKVLSSLKREEDGI